MFLLCFAGMSQFRPLAGALRSSSQWMRGHVGTGRRVFDPRRNCSSGAAEPSLAACGSSYVVEMYYAWLEDHKNVHEVQWTSTKGIEALDVPFWRPTALPGYPCNAVVNLLFHVLYIFLKNVKKASNGSFFLQSWDAYFRNAQASSTEETGERRLSTLLQGRAMSQTPAMSQKVVEDHLAVHTLIRAYQVIECM